MCSTGHFFDSDANDTGRADRLRIESFRIPENQRNAAGLGNVVTTQFFAVVIRRDSGPKTKDFTFSIFNNPVDEKQYVLISEYVKRLENVQSGEAVKMSGSQLVQVLDPELGVVINTENGDFAMPNRLLQWLRQSIQPVR